MGILVRRSNNQMIKPSLNSGERNGKAKLTNLQVASIKEMSRRGVPREELIKNFKVSKSTIQRIIVGEIWKHVK
jgi:DNA invertase Pin-like site-specific DNA recombinase